LKISLLVRRFVTTGDFLVSKALSLDFRVWTGGFWGLGSGVCDGPGTGALLVEESRAFTCATFTQNSLLLRTK
jgi:hypothetical protein